MKKTAKYLVIWSVALFALSACDKQLDFKPEDRLTVDALRTAEDGQALLNSCYESASSGNFCGGNYYLWSELMADNFTEFDLSGDRLAYYNRTTGIFISLTRDYLRTAYEMVYRANFLMDNLDDLEDLSPSENDRMRGEALTLRALGHFEMVRMFGQPYEPNSSNNQLGVPLRVEPSEETVLRSTVGEVYSQILSDLNEALNVVPEENGIYINKWAVHALLARVYFQQNNFERAHFHSNAVIESGNFSLTPTTAEKFQVFGGSTEGILEWASLGVNEYNTGTAVRDFYNGSSTFRIQPELYNFMLTTGNDRWQSYVEEFSPGVVEPVKWNAVDDFINVPFLHLTEMMLIRAESAAEEGLDLSASISDISAIRQRAGLGSVQTTDPTLLIDIVRNERRAEMFLEGNRLHELKRIAVLENPDLTIRGAIWNCPGLVVQLPDIELSGNENLTPNPEGGCN